MNHLEIHEALITRLQDRGQSAAAFRASCRRAAAALHLDYTVVDGHYFFIAAGIDFQFEAYRVEDGTVYILATDLDDVDD